jgi:16S rRNA A1518/A1519 N6-dimethyltransferase RsmA/KsgA/DIM1 with predicted DNA glycosylase/AP lyase activity
VILEIGPGTGNLTKKLLEAGKEVIAVELDSRMVLVSSRRRQHSPFGTQTRTKERKEDERSSRFEEDSSHQIPSETY